MERRSGQDGNGLPSPRAVYIHVPFCVHRCGYCDFTVVAGRDDLADGFLDCLEQEMAAQAPTDVATVFYGGGTPTLLTAAQLTRLFEIVAAKFRVDDGGEVTVEANPDGLTRDRVRVLAAAGVNRISLGAQSFDDDVLNVLERRHRADDIEEAADIARAAINNVSLDLMFGVPGQSLDSWRKTLARAIALAPEHVSTYGLTYEKGTRFWSRRRRGDLIAAHAEIERAMYEMAIESLAAGEFEQYELSNFARAGFRCRHNQTYWAAEPYLAFGPGAARYVDGTRETNHRSVFTWLQRVRAGESPVAETETLGPEDRAREAIALGLRRSEGIDREAFRQRFGVSVDGLAAEAVRRHVDLGNLRDDGRCLRLTREGGFVADSVVIDFL